VSETVSDSPGSVVAIGAELATENGLSYIPLNLENNRAALRFASELKDEPGIRFGANDEVKLGRWFVCAVGPSEVEPAAVEGVGVREGSGEVNGEMNPAQQLGAAHPAGAAHWAVVDGEDEAERLPGEAAEGGGVEVESRGGGGGVGGGGGGGEREEGRVGGEGVGADFAEARGGGGVHPGEWRGFCWRGKFESQRFHYETHEGTRIHCNEEEKKKV